MSASIPCAKLSQEWTDHIVSTVKRIDGREASSPETDLFRRMNDRLISIMRVELILEVMYELARNVNPSGEPPSRGEQVFVGFMQSLGQNIAGRKQVAEYAREAHLTVRHFSTLIRQYTGQTPMQWIHTVTMGQAKHLLRQTELRIKEVSEKLGFPDQFTFRRYFKTHEGVSPTEYRKNYCCTLLYHGPRAD